MCARKSERRKVESSEKLPSSNMRRNSQPFLPSPWIECGKPAGKYQRSPLETSPIKFPPSVSRAVTRALPSSMYAHSAWVFVSHNTEDLEDETTLLQMIGTFSIG